MISLTLPWPPTVNTYWRNVYGKTMLSRKGRAYRRTAIAEIVRQKAVKGFSGRVSVAIAAYPPDLRARDLDNILKPLLDALHHAGVIEDDSLIDELYVARGEKTEDGAVEVQVFEKGPDDLLRRPVVR